MSDIYNLINDNNKHEHLIYEPSTLRITFHITDTCNMACKYCYENKSNHIIPIEYAKELIDEVLNFVLHPTTSFLFNYLNLELDSIVQLDFMGGEVTLYMDIVEEICDYFFEKCQQYNLSEIHDKAQIILQSNGTTYFNDDVQSFFNKYGSRIIYPITIDGCEECHNLNRCYKNGLPTFDDVDRAVKAYINDYEIPNTKLTFNSKTFKYIKSSCEYLYSLGYKTIRMNTDITKKLTVEETNSYYNALVELADWIINNQIEFLPSCFSTKYTSDKVIGMCGMMGNQIAIDYYGNLFNCYRMAESSMGNLARPIGNIISKKIDFDFVNEFLISINSRSNSKCIGCPIKYGCEECPAENMIKNGSWYSSWNNCGQTVAQAKASKYFLQRVAETDYPYFKEELAKVQNDYDPDFSYLLYQENDAQQ